ncbi:MAG: hypothetical protein ACR65O_03310 [Methylomicrobium sp.]
MGDEFDKSLELYLLKINNWFQKYPENSTDFLTRLESHENKVHRAAVNELFWYNFALNLKWEIKPIPAENKAGENRPDFEVTSPIAFNCEITTLNEPDKKFFLEKELERIYGKWTDKSKKAQIEWSMKEKKPHILVIFDYSKLSGIGTQHQKSLPDFFQKPTTGLPHSPVEHPSLPEGLSSVLYLERYVAKGKFMLRMAKSVLIHNPNATFPLGNDMFDWLNQKEDLEII